MYTTIIPAADFLALAKIPAPGTSPSIHCVRVERDDYGVVGVATDGHVLAAIRFEADEATCAAPVSIRLHNENPDEALFRDVLGYLETATSVRRRSGEVVEFDPARIAYWKVVPQVLPQ